MGISESIKESATEGVDHANRMPEITEAMLAAGVKVLEGEGADVEGDKDKAFVKAIFTAMWGARTATN
jgi:hypothetical protein